MRCGLALLLCALFVVPTPARAADEDEDLLLLDEHTALAATGHATSAVMGTASVGRGLGEFIAAANGRGSPFAGLTYTLWGVAATISAATALEQEVTRWRRVRPSLEVASEADRRVFRQLEAARLRRAVVQRAIGLVADGTAVGIGLVLRIALPPSSSRSMGEALLIDGAFLLGVDLFRIVVDDQSARRWAKRHDEAHEGWFGRIRPPSVQLLVVSTPEGPRPAGLGFTGRF